MGQKQFVWLCTKLIMCIPVIIAAVLLLFTDAWFTGLLIIGVFVFGVMYPIYASIRGALEEEGEKTENNT